MFRSPHTRVSHPAQSPPSPPLTLLPQPQHLKRLLSENRWRRGPPDRTIKPHKEAVSFFLSFAFQVISRNDSQRGEMGLACRRKKKPNACYSSCLFFCCYESASSLSDTLPQEASVASPHYAHALHFHLELRYIKTHHITKMSF